MLRRRRFADPIARQLDVFVRDQLELLEACDEAELAYQRAERDEAEERYGDYQDLVETGTELLADLRDNFKRDARRGDRRGVRGRVQPRGRETPPRFGLEIENR